MAQATRTTAPSASIWHRLGTMGDTLAARWTQYQLYRQTRGELDALSDRDLADLGIHRADIHDIATDAAYRA